MFNLKTVLDNVAQSELRNWLQTLDQPLAEALKHGDLKRWQNSIQNLPNISPSVINIQTACLQIGQPDDAPPKEIARLGQLLRSLHPWRKGPYNLFGIYIDTEWRSDLKWQRFADHLQPLRNRFVLDIGCGNGYHGWRMIGEGAATVIGIDPYLLNAVQFRSVQKYISGKPFHFLPVGVEALPKKHPLFDTVFSLGLLYHRRSPLDHLFDVHSLLKSGGEFVLETLVIDGTKGEVLVPEDRYAKMRNVWFIPSPSTLESWLKRCGFADIRFIDVNRTTTEEQRSTGWMRYESLPDFLNPENPELTIEGLPAPTRAVFICEKT